MDYKKRFDLENKNIRELIDSIKIENKRLVIFAGAGISALCGLPLWGEFARRLVKDCLHDGYISYHDAEDYSALIGNNSKMLITLIYNIYKSKNKIDEFYDHFKNHLKSSDRKKEEKILSILKRMQVSIITTNADRVLDECVIKDKDIIYGTNLLNVDNKRIEQKEPLVIHIHGSVLDRESLIFTVDKYLETYNINNKPFYIKMDLLLNNPNNTLLFIGSSMTEMELLQYVIKKENQSSKFILNDFFDYQTELERAESEYYLNCFGIKQISYSKDEYGYENIINFLRDLSNEISISTNVIPILYNDIIKEIESENVEEIVQQIIYNNETISPELMTKVFEKINQSPRAIEIYNKLYIKKEEFFDISKYDGRSEGIIQVIILNSVASINDDRENKHFKTFINKYIKKIDSTIKLKDYPLQESHRIILNFMQILRFNLLANENKLISTIKMLLKRNIEYVGYIIYGISKFSLSVKAAFTIAKTIFKTNILGSTRFETYKYDHFLSYNLKKIMTYNSIGFFNVLRKEILKIDKEEEGIYWDMGAIFDYIDAECVTYEKYIVKVLKLVIENMLPSDVNRAFECCKNKKGLDLKIKIFIIDRHFEIMKERLNKELIDNVDSVASMCWLIKNNFEVISNDENLKNKILQIIEKCKFSTEKEKDALALKNILSSFVSKKDYKAENEFNSKYEYCEFYNIGKYIWVPNIDKDLEEQYKIIEKMTVCEIFNYLNSSKNSSSLLQDAVSEYFEDKSKIEMVLSNPNLFKSLQNEKYYRYILVSVCRENNIDREMIKKFVKNVYVEKFTFGTSFIWLEIIDKNNLLNDLSLSLPVLEFIFKKITEEYDCDDISSDVIIYESIDDIMSRCFTLLCEAHLLKNDIVEFVEQGLRYFENLNNYFFILSVIAKLSGRIYAKDRRIESVFDRIFDSKNEEKILVIFSSALLDTRLVKKYLTSDIFIPYYGKLSLIAKKRYGELILLHYMDFDKKLVDYIASHNTTDCSFYILDRYMKNGYGDLSSMLHILEEMIKNKNLGINMSGELLELLCRYPNNEKLRELCSKVAQLDYYYLNWDNLEEPLKRIHKIDEKYTINEIFIPISKRYLGEEKIYIEDKYVEIFDTIFLTTKNENCLDELRKLSRLAYQKGLIEFEKYTKLKKLVKA